MTDRFVVFDVETPNSANDRMSAIGVTIVKDGKITAELGTLVNPETYFNGFNIQLTGITPEAVENAPTFPQLWRELEPIFSDGILVAHNAQFDMHVLAKCLAGYGIRWKPYADYACTCVMGKVCYPEFENHKLNTMCEHLGIELDHHKASSDSTAAAKLLIDYIDKGFDVERYIRRFDFYMGRTIRRRYC